MKKIISLLAIFTTLFVFKVAAQSDAADVVKAFKTVNATEVANYFETLIDLTLPGKEEIKDISKDQARIALKNFFDENGVKSFDVSSQREAGPIMYIAGKMAGRTKPYNVTLLLKTKDGKRYITSIRIN